MAAFIHIQSDKKFWNRQKWFYMYAISANLTRCGVYFYLYWVLYLWRSMLWDPAGQLYFINVNVNPWKNIVTYFYKVVVYITVHKYVVCAFITPILQWQIIFISHLIAWQEYGVVYSLCLWWQLLLLYKFNLRFKYLHSRCYINNIDKGYHTFLLAKVLATSVSLHCKI